MTFSQMTIQGAWVHKPNILTDERGTFHEALKQTEIIELLGKPFEVKQVNQNVSARGVIRGIHFTDSPEGQAKFVTCPRGAIWDIVVDLRRDSSTYGSWDSIILSADNKYSVLISEGLGHAFLALEDLSTAHYLTTSEYNPTADKTVSPFSKLLNIPFLSVAEACGIDNFVLSTRDAAALSLISY